MSKEIYISSTPHETRLAIVEQDELTEIYYERENEYTLAGSIYNGKVTRVLPGMQSSFVDVGLERDAFLYITDFMEEAGDSADFDTADHRGRSGDRRSDSGQESRGNQVAPSLSDGHSAPEGDGASSPNTDLSSRGSQGAEGRTSDRNDRGRRRGRDGNRQDSQSRNPRVLPADVSQQDERSAPEAAAPSTFNSPAVSGDTELGEGAPGADGSRRWRGRRGRRRGRGGNREGQPERMSAASLDVPEGEMQVADLPTLLPDSSSGYDLGASGEDFGPEVADSAVETDATASAASLPETSESSADPRGYEETSFGTDRRPRGADRGRRDRGGRGRDRRDDQPRAPRGFAPSRSLYGVEDTSEGAGTAPAEPVILPGESLSKYRGGAEASASTPVAPAPAPVQDFTLSGSWDGGSVLPGETLRPRSASASAGDPRGSSRHEGGRDSGRRDSRGDYRERRGEGQPAFGARREGFRGGERNAEERTRPQQTADEASASLSIPASNAPFRQESAPVHQEEDGPAIANPPAAQQTIAEAAPALPEAQAPAPADSLVEAPSPAVSTPVRSDGEYEPTEGSASHHVDPLPVREFRQSAPETDTDEAGGTLAHSITPPAGTPLAPLHDEVALRPSSGPSDLAEISLAHDVTSISSEGEMLSAMPAHPPAQEIAEPTAPIHHETAVLQASVTEPAESHLDAGAAASLPSDAPEVSEAADDLIVEELAHDADGETDEEDFHTTTLHAASIEEMDYDDEETLEGAADLGTMIQEMSLDEMTQTAEPTSEEDDEFAFEEEDALGDEAFETAHSKAASADPMGFTEEDFTGRTEDEEGAETAPAVFENGQDSQRNDRRRGGRRDGRRGGGRDRGDRGRSPMASSGRESGDRERSFGNRSGRRDGHRSAQVTNLPAISDLLKPGQEVLVQIAKEPIAKKGARITSHIALPGRFLVFMPTVHHTGVSRKIESDGERRRLKEILLSEKGEAAGGFIVRTAAAGASEEELRSDLRFLLNLWADIKQRSESSKSPALIYHDLNLVERILRDQVTDNFSAIWVDTESEYERVLRFLQRFQPSLIRRVKLYTKDTPLFEQFGLTEEINKALRSKVWLKSGGSIVINQTEALVAIDINTGKYVGKTARLEDTIVKTNLDAIPEIVRQIRLRDLGGIIIIDFIDMDERKNRHRVMAALEDELKKDRAPSKVLQFNDFGLVAITRKRVKQSLERTLSTTCGVCAGTGMVKSAVTVCNDIYIEMRKMQKHLDRGDVMLRVNPEVVKQLKSPSAKWLQEMEEMVGKTILIKSDPTLHPEQFDIH